MFLHFFLEARFTKSTWRLLFNFVETNKGNCAVAGVEDGNCGSSTKSRKTVAAERQPGEGFDKCSVVFKHYKIIYTISMSECQPCENDNLSLKMKIYITVFEEGRVRAMIMINLGIFFGNKFWSRTLFDCGFLLSHVGFLYLAVV